MSHFIIESRNKNYVVLLSIVHSCGPTHDMPIWIKMDYADLQPTGKGGKTAE